MAGNRVCQMIVCNGEQVIVCGPAWFMNGVSAGSSGAWLHCLVLKHQMRVGNSGGGLHPSGAYLTWARPTQALQQRLEQADPVTAVEATITAEEETKPNYLLLKVAAALLVGYLLWKHFKK